MITKLSVGKISDVLSFIKFLDNQKKYLRDLTFQVSTEILEYVMREMDQLTKLKLYFRQYPDFLITNNFIIQETSLKELTIVYDQFSIRKPSIFQAIIEHYSNVETLKLDFLFAWIYSERNVDQIHLPKLKHIIVSFSDNFVLHYGAFDSLKSIYISNFRNLFSTNVRHVAHLEELRIKTAGMKMSTIAECFVNVKRLWLGDFNICSDELEAIIRKLPQLKALTIKKNSLQVDDNCIWDILNRLNRRNLKITLENDFFNINPF